MNSTSAREEYLQAVKLGKKEIKDRSAAGKDPYPAVLDELLPDLSQHTINDLSILEIPIDRIIGTMTSGRLNAFSASFYPLLDVDSEFGSKWISLCEAHLSDTGIREPIECYEYLGDFYVQEGNKRVSVLRTFGAARISARVRRVMPLLSDDPRIKAYYEYLDFFKASRVMDVQFTKPGSYAKLLKAVGKEPGSVWSDDERRAFSSRFHYFKEAFLSLGGRQQGLSPEEALLLWLQVHPYEMLKDFTPKGLKASLAALWSDVQASSADTPSVKTTPEPEKKKLLVEKLISAASSHTVNVAFVHMSDIDTSMWTMAHDKGASHLLEALGDQVKVRSYFHADTAEEAEKLLDEAVNDGAEVVFTTAPPLIRATLRQAVKYPKVRFLNCSAGTQYSSVRSYYCRTYEGKFISGLIAGAMADDNRIGYVGSYPILGVPASINAFALGAKMSNPRAEILLEWSCLPGDPVKKLTEKGVRVISNRDIPAAESRFMEEGRYGLFCLDEEDNRIPLASPVWNWGSLYETIVRSVLNGSYSQNKDQAVNYWWGMDSGAIDVEMTELIPSGVRSLAESMIRQFREGRLDPFSQILRSQDDRLMNDGQHSLTSLEVLNMDWLCDSVKGRLPEYEELLPMSRALVRELGIHRDKLAPEEDPMQ